MGFERHDLRDTGAMLFQLSYEFMKPRRKQVSASSIYTRYIKKVSIPKLGARILTETIGSS